MSNPSKENVTIQEDTLSLTKTLSFVSRPEIKIALVSMHIPEDCFVSKADRDDTIFVLKETKLKSFSKNFLQCAQSAARKGANLICFSELSYPYGARGLESKLANFAGRFGSHIVAGSYYDPRTFFNTSLIYTPYRNRPFQQYKYNLAQVAGEECKVPKGKPKFLLINTEFGVISVLICLDVADRNAEYKFEVLNSTSLNKADIEVILVPCYTNKFSQALGSCLRLSSKTNSLVVCVNDNSCSPQEVSCGAFFPGQEIKLKKVDKIGSHEIFMMGWRIDDVRRRRLKYSPEEPKRLKRLPSDRTL